MRLSRFPPINWMISHFLVLSVRPLFLPVPRQTAPGKESESRSCVNSSTPLHAYNMTSSLFCTSTCKPLAQRAVNRSFTFLAFFGHLRPLIITCGCALLQRSTVWIPIGYIPTPSALVGQRYLRLPRFRIMLSWPWGDGLQLFIYSMFARPSKFMLRCKQPFPIPDLCPPRLSERCIRCARCAPHMTAISPTNLWSPMFSPR